MTPEEKRANYRIAEKLYSEQNFVGAVLIGTMAMVLAACAWAVIGMATGYMVGYVAIALGAIVGLAVQFIGRGIDNKFTILATTLALVGCLLGNLIVAVMIDMKASGLSLTDILTNLSLAKFVGYCTATLTFVDILFWILAIWSAAHFAKRSLTQGEGVAVYTLRRRPEEHQLMT